MLPYFLSLAVGVGVGVVYGLVGVKSPAPPIIALIGLLGILAGEMAVSYWRGNSGVAANLLHRKTFAVDSAREPQSRPPV
jgi:XapX domain-containing protein